MKKKIPKYSNLPPYIYLQPNQRYQNTKTGQYLTSKELEAYSKPKEVKTERKLFHETIIERRWDLRQD